MIIKLKPPNKADRIALFIPRDTPVLRRIMNSFLSVLSTRAIQYQVSIHNMDGNIQEGEELIQEPLKDPSTRLIFAIGRDCTQVAKRGVQKQKKMLPILFGGVAKSLIDNGLINSRGTLKYNLTGVSVAETDHTKQLKYLLSINPNLKNIALLHIPHHGISTIARDYSSIQTVAKENRINIDYVDVINKKDLLNKLPKALKKVDAVIVSRDHLLLAAIETIVSICNNYNVMLCSSDLESVKYGATVGVGDFEQILGEESAKKAIEILQFNRHSSQIPITYAPCHYKLMVNVAALAKQKFDFETILNRAIGLNALMFV